MVVPMSKKPLGSGFLAKTSFLTAAALLSIGYVPNAFADTVKLHGATTVVNVLVNPHRATVEQATGHTLEIVGNATGKGLVDLSEAKADASMSSEPLDIAVAAAEVAGKQIDPKTLQFHEVRTDEIVFVVHPANPVTQLTWEQLRDIHTGKITNWKQVGGKDQPITVYSDALTGGTRAMVKKVVMDGAEYADSVKSLTAVARVAEMVAKDEKAIGGVGKGFVDSAKQKIVDTQKIERPLGFITVGAPSAKVQQVIDAFKSASK
jgi:phosphate transport system substrate-binding protein